MVQLSYKIPKLLLSYKGDIMIPRYTREEMEPYLGRGACGFETQCYW